MAEVEQMLVAEQSSQDADRAILQLELEILRRELELKENAHAEALQQAKDENETELAEIHSTFQKASN